MNLHDAHYLRSAAATAAQSDSTPTLCLPPSFPFLSEKLVQSSQFQPGASDSDSFLRRVLSPPAVTTVRVIHPLHVEEAADADDDDAPQRRERAAAATASSSSAQVSLKQLQTQLAAVNLGDRFDCKYFPDEFPDVLFVVPKMQKQHQQNSLPQEGDLVVVVDAGCGEAVLRGGDAFAPGVLAATRSFDKGDVVPFVVSVISASHHTGATGLSGAAAPLVGTYVDLKYVQENCAIVARNAVAAQGRGDIFNTNQKKRTGVAVETHGGLFGHPSLSLIESGFSSAAVPSKPFLQNLSSMIPAPMLAALVLAQNSNSKTPLRFLDCCAAPGGKSSHLLSSLALLGADASTVRLVCVERSSTRAKQLKALLVAHHGAATISQCVLVVAGDANNIAKPGTAEQAAVRAFLKEADADDVNSPPAFHGVLLDPPCTGFGLRPRLRPFEGDESLVTATADYQRKLMSTAVQLVGRGGFVSYSTCTTSVQENEMNVKAILEQHKEAALWILTLGDLPLAQRSKVELLAGPKFGACRFSAVVGEQQNGDGENVQMAMRFGPSNSSLGDGVGFFLALFQKV